jgi:hypothetical protein
MEIMINEEIARTAHTINSMSEYKPNQATNEFNSLVNQFNLFVDTLIKNNKLMDQEKEAVLEEVETIKNRYAYKLAEAINTNSRIESQCASVLISGAGNFPTRKKEKQNQARDNFYKEYGQLFDPTNNYYIDKIKNLLQPKAIKSGDELAIEKLELKIEELKKYQETMKKANAYFKKNGNLDNFQELTAKEKHDIERTMQMMTYYKGPFPGFNLTNNGANIRRLEKRLEDLKKIKTFPTMTKELSVNDDLGFEIVENTELMRLQLKFNGKPEEEVRSILKSNGFKWAPSQSAWQRQLNGNGQYAVKRVIEALNQLGQ